MTKKLITASINLPVQSISTIINVDNRDVEVSIDSAISTLRNIADSDEQRTIRTMNTIAYIPQEYTDQYNIPYEAIEVEHDIFNIVSIKRAKIEKTNPIKFFKVKMTFSNDISKEFIVPSYVKFYSSRMGSFIPVEFLKSRHILIDFEGNIVKAEDSELIENFNMTDYYNIKAAYDLDEKNIVNDKPLPCTCNFYLNGVLANVAYNNFQIKETVSAEE